MGWEAFPNPFILLPTFLAPNHDVHSNFKSEVVYNSHPSY